jgi:uncharacterized lipoprotein
MPFWQTLFASSATVQDTTARFLCSRPLVIEKMFARKAVHYFGRALRETGQALDRVGLRIADKEIFRETFSRHRQQLVINDKV